MTYNPFGAQTYNLQSSISSTATEIVLSSFTEPVTGVPYTMVLLNTDIVYATIAPKTTSSEFVSFTGITQNSDGTATLTGVTRGLAKKYPFISDADYKLPHSGQAQFIISDAPQVFEKYAAIENDNVFTGFNEGPDPLSPQGYVTNDYMLNLINGGPISIDSFIQSGIAGETIVAGDLIYFSESDNEWKKTDADTLATVLNVKLGIAQGAGTNGNPITDGVLTYGTYTTSGLTQGDLIYASNTAGGFSNVPGTTPRVIGIAKDITHLYFDPYFQSTPYAYAVDSVGTDSYAVTLAGAYGAYYPGMIVTFKAGTANTGTSSLAINGGAAKTIKKNATDDLQTGDILANQVVMVEYDGVNFQLISANTFLASTTVKGVVEEATGSEFNAGTQTGATGAELFINSVILPGKHMGGALGNTVPKTYFNMQFPFLLWTGATSGAVTTDFPNWVRTSDVYVPGMGAMCDFIGSGSDVIYIDDGFFHITAGTFLNWSLSNKIVIDFFAKLPASGTGDLQMGFAVSDADLTQAYNGSGETGAVTFALSSAGVLYATVAKNGGVTNTDISSGLTLTAWNNYRIELDLGSQARFYVNGVLKATIPNTNMYTGSSDVTFGFGRSNTTLFQATAPNISLQLI